MTLRANLVLVGAALLCIAAAVALGAPSPDSAKSPDKLALRFDFENDTNAAGFPDDWVRKEGTAHPQNVRERLDAAEHHSGSRSFLVEPDGRTNLYETDLAYPLDPQLSWRLTGWIKTSEIPSTGPRATVARIEISGYADAVGPSLFTASTVGVTGTTDWRQVAVDIPRDPASPVRFVRLRCITDGKAIGGKVWFDDITLAPRPGLRASTEGPAAARASWEPEGCYAPGAAPVLALDYDTLLGGGFRLSAKLFAPGGAEAMNIMIDLGDREGRRYLALPLATPGVYHLSLELTQALKPVASISRSLLLWPDSARGDASRDFGVYAGSPAQLDEMRSKLLLRSGFGALALDLFGDDPGATVAQRAAAAAEKLHELDGAETVAVLGRVPPGIVSKLFQQRLIVNETDATWQATLASDPADWSQELLDAVKPWDSRVVYWQIGLRSDHRASAPALERALRQLRETLRSAAYKPRLGFVLDGTEPKDVVDAACGGDFVVLEWSSAIDATLAQWVARLRAKTGEVWISVPVPKEPADAASRASVLAKLMTRAKAAGADRVLVNDFDALLAPSGDPTESLFAASSTARGRP